MKTGTMEPVSSLETWTDTIEFYDDEDGLPFDLSDVVEITLRLREIGNSSHRDYGSYASSTSYPLSGSLTGGELAILGDAADGTVEFTFDNISALCARTYEVGVIIETETEKRQVILGRIPVLQGL